ncbi:MAG: Cdc6/Cdc18 family protein [Candidatus Odinarchaeota archaeon]
MGHEDFDFDSPSEFEKFLRDSSVFKNAKALTQSFLPARILHRKSDIESIVHNFRPLLLLKQKASTGGLPAVNGFSCNLAVIGNPGVGKTATVRYTGVQLEKIARKKKYDVRLIVNHVNCWNNRTRSSILASIMRDAFKVVTRGLSTEEIIDLLRQRLSIEDCYLILILDEVHILSINDLKSFIHLTEWMADRISVIMITRTAEWSMILDPEINQRIFDVHTFEPYTRNEMFDIITDRVSNAFNDGTVEKSIINMVTEIAMETENVRHGIEILYQAGKEADKTGTGIITPEFVRKAKCKVHPELRPEVLLELNEHELYTALGIAQRLLNRNFSAVTVKEAYRHYLMVTKKRKVKANTESAFRTYLEALNRYGLISILNSTSTNGRGSSRLRITIFDVPARVLVDRIESRLEVLEKKHSNP